jgi:hypothetical protein
MIGRGIEYEVITENGPTTRVARVKSVEFTDIGPVFNAVSPYGNKVRLTRSEISRVLPKKK